MSSASRHYVLAAGGTGGHLIPAFALATELEARGHHVALITDERGSREYNLSLGQRRSVAVKKSLNLLGVQDAQIETVSFGEEKATAACADEACAKQNRRADIVYENE